MVVTWTYTTPRNGTWRAARRSGRECRGRYPPATRAARGTAVGHAAEDAGFKLWAVPVSAPGAPRRPWPAPVPCAAARVLAFFLRRQAALCDEFGGSSILRGNADTIL